MAEAVATVRIVVADDHPIFRHGLRKLIGTVPADEVGITRLLRRAGLRPTAVSTDGTLHLSVPLSAPAAMA